MPKWVRKIVHAVATAASVLCAIACGATSELHELPDGALVVDVRIPAEFAAEHFPGAINLPLGDIDRRSFELGEKDRPIVVYCRSGHRSAAAKKELERHGFTNISDGGALGTLMKLAEKDRP